MSLSTKQQTRHPGRRPAPVIVKVGPQQWVLNHCDDEPADDAIYHEDVDTGWDDAAAKRDRPIAARFPNLTQRLAEMEDAAVRLFQSDRTTDAKEARPAIPARRHKKRLRESFQVGLIIGMILGCISLVMFHQVEPSSIQAVPSAKLVEAAGARQVTMPAVTLDRVAAASGLSQEQAQVVQASLKKHGITSSLWREKHGFDVVTAVGMTSSDLQAQAARAAKIPGVMHAHVQAYHTAAAAVSAGQTLSQRDAEQISEWLSAMAGSLNTIIAVSADHASLRDADAAYHTAEQQRPSQAVLNRSGYSGQLAQLTDDWRAAYSAISKKRNAAANIEAANAVGQITEIEYAPVGD